MGVSAISHNQRLKREVFDTMALQEEGNVSHALGAGGGKRFGVPERQYIGSGKLSPTPGSNERGR